MSLVALLVMMSVPENPEAALSQLARYGKVPECMREERIEKTTFDHRHAFSRPLVLASLAGKTPELMPFLEHQSRRVVLRAVELLCHSDGPEAPKRVAALARQFPCEGDLRAAASQMATERVPELEACAEAPAPPRLAPARTLMTWPADGETAKAISAGDLAALERVVWQLDALEPLRARMAAATLARVDSERGVLATLRAVGFDDVDALWRGLIGAQLEAIASKRKVSRVAAYALVVAAASVEDRPRLASLESRLSTGERGELEKEAEKLRRSPEVTPFGRAWLENLAKSQHDWLTMRKKVGDFVSHRDRPALRAYVKDEANGIGDRLEAAKELALLGDASGLTLWESDAGLWTEERTSRRGLLLAISHDAPPEVRVKAEALLTARWSL